MLSERFSHHDHSQMTCLKLCLCYYTLGVPVFSGTVLCHGAGYQPCILLGFVFRLLKGYPARSSSNIGCTPPNTWEAWEQTAGKGWVTCLASVFLCFFQMSIQTSGCFLSFEEVACEYQAALLGSCIFQSTSPWELTHQKLLQSYYSATCLFCFPSPHPMTYLGIDQASPILSLLESARKK